MAKKPTTATVKRDTTVIKTPMKVSYKELNTKGTVVTRDGSGVHVKPKADSTIKKVIYNMNDVSKSIAMRNTERKQEGKAPITNNQVFGSNRTDKRESTKGNNFSTPKKKK